MPRSPKRNRESLRKLASHKRASLVADQSLGITGTSGSRTVQFQCRCSWGCPLLNIGESLYKLDFSNPYIIHTVNIFIYIYIYIYIIYVYTPHLMHIFLYIYTPYSIFIYIYKFPFFTLILFWKWIDSGRLALRSGVARHEVSRSLAGSGDPWLWTIYMA